MATDARLVIVVLGMHRSGTSAVAAALVERGANAGAALLPSTSDNANGYFEDARLVAASDAILAACGSAWDVPGPLPAERGGAAVVAAVEAMGEVFRGLGAGGRPAVAKDPRACRLVREWSDALARASSHARFVIVLRDPREVAASLAARDGMSHFRAEQLWLEHLLEAECATRGSPRCFVDYGALVQAPVAAVDAVLATLGIAMPPLPSASIGAVDTRLRRQRAEARPSAGLAGEVYGFARGLAGTAGEGRDVFEAFDGYRARWRETARVAASALDDERQRAELSRAAADKRGRAVRQGAVLSEDWPPPQRRQTAPRVYWRDAAGAYSEAHSRSAVAMPDSAAHHVRIGAPGSAIAYLRIDPDDRAGAFTLEGLTVSGVPLDPLAPHVTASHGVRRDELDGRITLFAVDDDPWLEVALPSELASRREPMDVSVQVRSRGLADLAWGFLDEQARDGACVSALEARIAGLEARIAELADGQRALEATTLGAMHDLGEQQRRAAREVSDRVAENATTLAALERDVVEVLGWVRRRTLGYWWRRWRHRMPGADA